MAPSLCQCPFSCLRRKTILIAYALHVGGRHKTCDVEDLCEGCHDWSDDKCRQVGEYLVKLSAQREKKLERKVKASSSSFLGFSPPMLVPLCNLPFPLCSGVVTTTSLCSDVFGCYTLGLRCSVCSSTGCDALGTMMQASQGRLFFASRPYRDARRV